VRRAILFGILTALCLAQRSRDAYRAAYSTWRQTDQKLEMDAAQGGAPVAQRADRMAAEAAQSAAARKAFLDGTFSDEAEQIAWLETPLLNSDSTATDTKSDSQFIATESTTVNRTIDTFSNDPDKGIQQLRQALAREKIALDGLRLAVAARKKSADTVTASTAVIAQARSKSAEQSRAMLEGLKDAIADNTREGEAWVEYYRKLGEGAQGTATPITVVPPGVPPATLTNPAPAPRTVTPVPLARYVGEWTFPATNGLFHGPQPESIEVVVNEDNGHATGTLSARFKLPPGSTGDPTLRFDFSGDFQPTRNQSFDLLTSDGAKGTVELIPASAFNLLEVNFRTELKEGKIRQSDVVLVKK